MAESGFGLIYPGEQTQAMIGFPFRFPHPKEPHLSEIHQIRAPGG
jgi:hypothetical protein